MNVNVLINGKPVAAQAGETVATYLVGELSCGGHGKCGKCKVRASGALSPLSASELALLTEEEREIMMSNLRGYRRWLDKAEKFGTDAEEIDYYLSMCRYSAVTNGSFRERMAQDPVYREKLATATTASRPELAKEFAIRDFVEHVFHMIQRTHGFDRSVSIGFSDDDAGNVKSVSAFIRRELARRFDGIKFVVYDTSDPELAKGRKVCVSGQLNLPGF